MKCKLCDLDFKNGRFLLAHLKTCHKEISKLEYLMNYHFNSKIGLCRNCGKQVKFISFSKYDIYCCKKCRQEFEHKHPEIMEALEKKKQQTLLEKYGVTHPMAIKGSAEKLAKTKLDLYGDSKYNNIEKYKETCIKKYGVDNIFKDTEYIKKCVNEKYGVDNIFKLDSTREKIRKTNLELYGSEYASQSNLIKEKTAKTCIERYGVKSPAQNKEIYQKQIETNLKLYGVEHYSQAEMYKKMLPEIQNKIKETSLKKYGAEHYSRSEEFKKLQPLFQEKTKQSNLKKFGVERAIESSVIQQKIYNTKKQNNSFNTSKPELKLLKILQDKFGISDIEYQYKSPQYPFACDFYIKSLDLYIELQGSWTHGKAPYDAKNPDHIKKLNEWIQKSQTSQFYRNAIDVWTCADVEKRKTVKENGIKLIEVFDSETFKELDFILKKI